MGSLISRAVSLQPLAVHLCNFSQRRHGELHQEEAAPPTEVTAHENPRSRPRR